MGEQKKNLGKTKGRNTRIKSKFAMARAGQERVVGDTPVIKCMCTYGGCTTLPTPQQTIRIQMERHVVHLFLFCGQILLHVNVNSLIFIMRARQRG